MLRLHFKLHYKREFCLLFNAMLLYFAVFCQVCTSEVRCYCAHGFTGADCALRTSRTVFSTVASTSADYNVSYWTVTDNGNATFNGSTLQAQNEQQVAAGMFVNLSFKVAQS
jgi:hypothetical protein